MRIPSPFEIQSEFPLTEEARSSICEARESAKQILYRNDARLVLLVGPCSVHDPEVALEYGEKLRNLSKEIKHLYLVMRLFLEKPRTRSGWKGIVYDPFLDGSNDIAAGLRTSRKLLLEMAKRKIPTATELLEPLVAPYFADLLTWGMIGARTSASQPHRQMASGLPFPIGFKNDMYDGKIDAAISGIFAARLPHSHISIDMDGRVAAIQTKGNPLTHLVLRGSESTTNFDPQSVAMSMRTLHNHQLEPHLLIDCSHGNSGKDHRRQHIAFQSAIQQSIDGNRMIAGLMLESHLFPGKQSLSKVLHYGVSITDSCLGWEETEALIRWADEQLSCRSSTKDLSSV